MNKKTLFSHIYEGKNIQTTITKQKQILKHIYNAYM